MGGNKTPILDETLLADPSGHDWIRNYHSELLKQGFYSGPKEVPCHIRRITTLEAAAIQTFPDGYEFAGEKSSVYRQIGNAVPCRLAAAVAKACMETLGAL
jgi:DNA (cytosine-5)-methyltransferase 1